MNMLQAKKAVPVDEIVDFEKQIDTFNRIRTGEDPKRLLFIRAPSGRGKTSLLRQMREYCRSEGILSCWIDFRFESYDAPHLTLAREICEQLELTPQLLAQALLPLSAYEAKGEATTIIEGDVIDSKVVTQVLIQVPLADEGLHKEHIKQRLRRAFAADLSAIEGVRVCFFDTFEDISNEEETWLLNALLHPVRERELERMIVVTSGRRWPDINDWEWADDANLIDGLPPMSEEHIQDYARRLGYAMSAEEARMVWRASRGGLPIFMGMVVKNLIAVG
jgi:hypothetical protein